MEKLENIGVLLDKYNYPVPRYTSFPTAMQFNQKIPQDRYSQLLSGLTSSESVCLYVHIPFCHSLCHYCGCHTKVVNSYDPIESYLRALLTEIILVGQTLSYKVPVNLVHFGGGSPNYLKSEDLKRIVNTLSEFFKITDQTQIDIESDPRYLGTDLISCFADMGVTRVSLGVQDFDRNVQEAINRIQPFEQVKNCVNELRDSGINQINFDLMIGLPKQTIETVRDTAERAASLSPDRLAVFPYAHVPWMKQHQKLLEKYPMADGQERFFMNGVVDGVLKRHAYKSIGMDHYACETDPLFLAQKQGRLRRNFQGYTTDVSETIIGFGLSSISSFKSAYIQNTTDPIAYRNTLKNDQFPIQRGCVLSDEDQALRFLIEELMCRFEVDLDGYRGSLGGVLEELEQKLAELEKDQLIIMRGSFLKITKTGKPFTRVVASCFDPYLQARNNQHAKAI